VELHGVRHVIGHKVIEPTQRTREAGFVRFGRQLHQALDRGGVLDSLRLGQVAPVASVSVLRGKRLGERQTNHSLRTAAFSRVHPLFLPAAIFLAMYASTLGMVASSILSTTSSG